MIRPRGPTIPRGARHEDRAVFEYVIAGVIYSAFTCWYLFWPGALLLGFGIH